MRRTNAGFSLIEVMIATAILGIGLTGVIQAVTASIQSSQDTEHLTCAVCLASGQMEMTLADPFLSTGTQNGSFDPPFSAYRWKVDVKETGEEGLHEVSVAVSRADSDAILYELTTLAFVMPDADPLEEDTEGTRPARRPVPRLRGDPR
jgi:type II secretion system protein I